jgi:tRNA threonylcarbamoyladenosine biosynthesis protein TsaB
LASILIIESTGYNCSVAICNEQGEVPGCIEELSTEQYIHTEKLHRFIGDCLLQLELSFSDLDAVAVSQGPGSYTGLRYGVSAAKGFCSALDIPLISVNPFRAMLAMYSSKHEEQHAGKVAAMIDARREEVFIQTFDLDNDSYSEVKALIVDEQHGLENHVWIGDGADKFAGVDKYNAIEIHKGIYTSAVFHAREAAAKFVAKDFEDLAYFVPFYLKDFVATKPKTKFSIKGIPKISEE